MSLPAGPVTVRIASTSAIGPEIDLLRASWNDQRPTLTVPSLPHAFEGVAYTASIAGGASDADPDDTLTFSKLDGPAWLTVASDGTLGGTPDAGDVGATTFRVRVTDSSGLVDDETIALEVEGRPTTPGTPELSAGTSPNGGVFALAWTASSDPEGLAVTYALQHRDADDAGYSDVATALTSPTFAFIAGTPEAEGTWRYRARASDGTLTSDYSSDSAPVKVDRTAPLAPTASPDRAPEYAGDGGWYRDTVTVSFAPNGDPALPDSSAGSGVDATTIPAPQVRSTSGSHTVSGTVSDVVGNASDAGSLTVKVDATDPIVSITCPTTDPIAGTAATAPWTASDTHSGLASAANGTVALDTSTAGTRTATAPTATDNVGRTAGATCTYTVRANPAPVAVDDAYSVIGGGVLNVAAPGVLGNDSDPDGSPLMAELVSAPGGMLVLNPNGSFTYTPGEDTIGAVTFTYRASDGTSSSNVATVRITVAAGCDGMVATHVGTSANNVLKGTSGNDVIVGLGGSDTIDAGSGNDRVCGGSGNDVIEMGSGNDRVLGGSGNDAVTAGSGDDSAFGGAGNDRLDGGGDRDRLFGDAGVDQLFGGGDPDLLDGGADAPDRCDGEGGTDTATGCESTFGVP